MSRQDDFLAHEVLHTALIPSETFDRSVSDHRFVKANEKLRERAAINSVLLGEFYQATGEQPQRVSNTDGVASQLGYLKRPRL